MQVKRIVANVPVSDPGLARKFYEEVLGWSLLMDHGWIMTYGARTEMSVQLSFATQGGSDTAVPNLSIEVDDVDAAFERMCGAGFPIEYGLTDEPWWV